LCSRRGSGRSIKAALQQSGFPRHCLQPVACLLEFVSQSLDGGLQVGDVVLVRND
jgi:hypothetical protein